MPQATGFWVELVALITTFGPGSSANFQLTPLSVHLPWTSSACLGYLRRECLQHFQGQDKQHPLLISPSLASHLIAEVWSDFISSSLIYTDCSEKSSCPSCFWECFPELFAPSPSQKSRWSWWAYYVLESPCPSWRVALAFFQPYFLCPTQQQTHILPSLFAADVSMEAYLLLLMSFTRFSCKIQKLKLLTLSLHAQTLALYAEDSSEFVRVILYSLFL